MIGKHGKGWVMTTRTRLTRGRPFGSFLSNWAPRESCTPFSEEGWAIASATQISSILDDNLIIIIIRPKELIHVIDRGNVHGRKL